MLAMGHVLPNLSSSLLWWLCIYFGGLCVLLSFNVGLSFMG